MKQTARPPLSSSPQLPLRKRRPTYAGVTATLALIVALGGTSYAAGLGRGSVDTRELARGAVTTSKIKGQAVTSGKVRDRSLKARDFKRGLLPPSRAFHTERPLQYDNAPFPYTSGGIQVDRLDLPSGKYVVSLSVEVGNFGSVRADAVCTLVGATTSRRLTQTLAPDTVGTVAGTGVVELTARGSVSVRCRRSLNEASLSNLTSSLTATQVSDVVTR